MMPLFQGEPSTWNAPSSTLSATLAGIPALNDIQVGGQPEGARGLPIAFREEHAGLVVKGNFLTLAAKPELIDEVEWLAHQVVEQFRLLRLMIGIVQSINQKTESPLCNPECCPAMSASIHTYYWLDNQKRPVKVPASLYIQLVERWIDGKIRDPTIFPTDTSPVLPTGGSSGSLASNMNSEPTESQTISPLSAGDAWSGTPSGFRENYEVEFRSIYQQMMRCYAHLYHGHWLGPFWNLDSYRELNTCFVYFVTVGRLYKLVGDTDMEPMRPLIDLWLATGVLPDATP